MSKKNTTSNSSREQRLDNIQALLHALQQDKSYLARPYADLFTYALLPLSMFFVIGKIPLIHSLNKNYVREVSLIQNFLRKTVIKVNDDFKLLVKDHNFFIFGMKSFEKLLQNFSQLLSGKFSSPYPHLQSIVDSSIPPYSLDQLATSNQRHSIFQLAKANDLDPSTGISIRDAYFKMLNLITIMGLYHLPQEVIARIPELQIRRSRLFDIEQDTKLTTYRIAEIIKELYPHFTNAIASLREKISDEEESYLFAAEYLLLQTTALLAKSSIINPTFTKILPLNWYLKEPINLNLNYNLLNLASLKKEEAKLSKAHQALRPYAKRHQQVSYAINSILLGLGLYFAASYSEGRTFFIFLALPLILGTIINLASTTYQTWQDSHNLDQQLADRCAQLKSIFTPAANHINIELHNRKKLSLSTLRLKIVSPYSKTVSTSQLANVIKQTLLRFDIELLTSYTQLEFSIPAQFPLKRSNAIRQFLIDALARTTDIQQLKKQLNTLGKVLKNPVIIRNIYLDKQGLQTSQYTISTTHLPRPVQACLLQHDFVLVEGNLTLNKNTPFQPSVFDPLCREIKHLFDSAESQRTVQLPAVSQKVEPEQRRHRDKKVSDSHQVEPIAIETIPVKTIKWPNSKATYPGNVKPIRGTSNQYILWTLKEDDFGDYKSYYPVFKDKSSQLAAKNLGTAGIKNRPTVASYHKRTCLFPAHVKVPGTTTGNSGVVLDIEKAATGETLFITRTFEPSIHKRL